MQFWIQASNPKSLRTLSEEDQSIFDAVETVFPLITEEAFLVWHHVHVPLSYKYTISFLITDVVNMAEMLMRNDSGELTINWPASEFRVTWEMKWHGTALQIHAQWESTLGSTESLLSAHPTLSIDKNAFISEWKQVLGITLKALTDAGYTEKQLSDLARLREVHDGISEPGILYR
jgi:hypothetical protein